MVDAPLTPLAEDVPLGDTDWFQNMIDRWAAVDGNFDLLVARITAAVQGSVRKVNGMAPDPSTGAVTIPLPAGAVVDVFPAGGAWTKRTGAKAVYVMCVQGGQGGNSGPFARATPSASTETNVAGDVSAFPSVGGRVATRLIAADALPASVAVGVGLGGAGGVGPTAMPAGGTYYNPGASGGDSSFGSFVTTAMHSIKNLYTSSPPAAEAMLGTTGATMNLVTGDAGVSGLMPGNGATGKRYSYGTSMATQNPTLVAPTVPATPAYGSPAAAGASGTDAPGTTATNVRGANGGPGGAGGTDTAGGLGGGGGPGGAGGFTLNGQQGTLGDAAQAGGDGGAGGAGGFPGGGGGTGGPPGEGTFNWSSRRGTPGNGGKGGDGVVVAVTMM